MNSFARALSLDNPADAMHTLRPPLQFLNEALSGLSAHGHQQFSFSPAALEGLAVICDLLALVCAESLEAIKK